MSDHIDTDDENLDTDNQSEKRSGNGTVEPINALEFVDDAIDAVEDISELSIEALVVMNVLCITKRPEDVSINIIRSQRLTIIELDVHTSDLAALIGREGHTINSIRAIARASAGKSEIKYVIYPLEDGKPPRLGISAQGRYSPRPRRGRAYRKRGDS